MTTRLLLASFCILAWNAAGRADDLLPADLPIEQAIDQYVEAALKRADLKPAAPGDDATLLRRLTLDLNGRIPTTAELRDYLANDAADKRVRLVDQLLASPAFVRHQAAEFETLLMTGSGGASKRSKNGGTALRDYLQRAFAENRSWDSIFRDLLGPDDNDPAKKGASEFLRSRVKDLDRLTVDVSVVFFGVNISCAQCHDHPRVDDWKQDHFFGMKAFFSRTYESGSFVGEREFGLIKFKPRQGSEKPARVMFLTGKTIDDVPGWCEPTREQQQKDRERVESARKVNKPPPPVSFSLRSTLVAVALEPGQRDYFARAVVNRVWHRLTGQGLVMPLDQMHSENPASHPELLHWLARDLIAHGYDLRRLIRGMVLSKTYALDSRWDGDKQPEPETFAVARARLLTPRQLATSLKLATADPGTLGAALSLEQQLEAIEKNAAGLAALLPNAAASGTVGVGEALLFTNSETIQKECLSDEHGRLVARLLKIDDLEKRADAAVRAVLSRPSRPDEVTALVNYLRRRPDRPSAAVQQVVWALLTSSEFRFNH